MRPQEEGANAMRRLILLLISLDLVAGCTAPPTATVNWTAKKPPLATQWTAQVTPTNALPEYPRPQMARQDWQNLNGVWQFAAATEGQVPPFNQTLAEGVMVPFPIESALSGIQRHEDRMW